MQRKLDTMTQAQAAAHAREWIDNRVGSAAEFEASQTRWLMDELAALCIDEALREQEGELELNSRLSKAWDVVYGLWRQAAPGFAKKIYYLDVIGPHPVVQLQC